MPLYALHWSSVALLADADAMLATVMLMGADLILIDLGLFSTSGAPEKDGWSRRTGLDANPCASDALVNLLVKQTTVTLCMWTKA